MNRWTLHHGDCLAWLRTLPSASVDAIVTDPPAGIAFMGKAWDHHKGGRAEWVAWLTEVMRECLRILKPGGHALVWSLPRTEHWTACAVEDAGFEIRDGVYHLCAQGWPKSLDVSKAIDAAAGAEREMIRTYTGSAPCLPRDARPWKQAAATRGYHEHASKDPVTDDAKRWGGGGTARKPAVERWILARKPLAGTVAANVLAHGVGALNVDGCRVEGTYAPVFGGAKGGGLIAGNGVYGTSAKYLTEPHPLGRWPSNVVLSHAETCGDECDPACPAAELDRQSGILPSRQAKLLRRDKSSNNAYDGGASRFFPCFHPFGYYGKAKSANQRGGKENAHPTVKNVDLMRWLVRLITPPGGLVVDAFAGSGTTGVAALLEGCRFAAAEADADSYETARARLAAAELGETVIRGTSTRTAEPHPQPARRKPQTEMTEQVFDPQLRLPGAVEETLLAFAADLDALLVREVG